MAGTTRSMIFCNRPGTHVLWFLCFLLPVAGMAQTTTPADTAKYRPSTRPTNRPRDRQGDPFANPDDRSPVLGTQPGNVQTKVELDSVTNNYTIYEKVGNLDYRPVSTMTFDEYTRWRQRQSMTEYMRQQAEGSSQGGGALANNRLIPKIYIAPFFDRIFGGNEVDIRPNGSIVLDMGWQRQQVFNPSLPIRQQTNSQFLFDQQISLNVLGKIGQKLKFTLNYDTKATFEFENNLKLEYSGLDHEILQKVEAGNVSLPVSSSLIRGAQNLFGVKTTMQFGRMRVVTVASTQRGKSDKLRIKGGAQTRDISIRVDQYEANRHFFLSQFFRNNYERALQNPAINPPPSGVVVNRVEVYITNRANNTTTLRNMVALADLGEGFPYRQQYRVGQRDSLSPSFNKVNALYDQVKSNQQVRNSDTSNSVLTKAPFNLSRSVDFELIRGARRLTDRDYTFHPQLGYVSLNTPLRDDEVLAVAFEYTYNGQVYRVGELQEEYVNLPETDVVILKLLRPSTIQTRLPTWNLQMKNIYSLGASQVSKEGFQLRVIYRDDSSGVDNPVMRLGRRLRNRQLVQVMNLDRLNPGNELQPDGNFDFIEGLTIDSRNGRIIFPVLEPFGSHLARQYDLPDERQYVERFAFTELYTSTQADALQAANKAKFFLVGKMQSSSSSEIMLPGVNIAPGSVVVTAGITPLVEGTHYTVDYQLGRVRIIDNGVLASGQEIEIRYEKADLFSFQQRSFLGNRFDYKVNKDINIGGTLLYLNERPLIRRVAIGSEPTTNILWGIDFNYNRESRTLTKILDKLPFYSTKEPSVVSLSGEYARLMPGANLFVDPSGQGISYVDDFEGVRTPTDLTRQSVLWRLSSIPNEIKSAIGVDPGNPLSQNFRRARMAWYNIDNLFYASSNALKPGNITSDDMKNPYVRAVGPQEVFPNRDLQAVNLNEITLDLAYYPSERGPYNYNPNLTERGFLPEPRRNWGAMMRAITNNTDFDAANIEYAEFWVMDPFINTDVGGNADGSRRNGEMYLQFGSLSEDVLPDGRHSFENGLPTPGQRAETATTTWGQVTRQQFLTPAFDNNPSSRPAQDVGLDGLNDEAERSFFNAPAPGTSFNFLQEALQRVTDPDARAAIEADPSADNFNYYLGANQDQSNAKVLDRYKRYNGVDGNSPIANSGAFTAQNYPFPDNEDINADNTVSETDAYFSYRIGVSESDFREVGRNYIVDRRELQDGTRWFQFRIPLRDLGHPNFAGTQGPNPDFKNIRFMRVMLTGFEVPVVMRMVQFQLVASTWRPYPKQLPPPWPVQVDEGDAQVTVASVNVEENGNITDQKVPYVVPPGVSRDRDVTSGVNRRLNEQALSLCVDRLRADNAKAVFKNVRFDFLNYRRLRMYISAQSNDPRLQNRPGAVSAFVRLGTDFDENYYEVEIPLQLSVNANGDPRNVWPEINELNILFSDLYQAKSLRNLGGFPMFTPFRLKNVNGSNQNVTVVGNPDLNSTQTIMMGVRQSEGTDGRPVNICVWFNELRVTDYEKNQGWAATGRAAFKLADLGNLTATGKFVGIGFGGIEEKISERTRDNTYSYNVTSNLLLDKFTPKRLGLRLPMYVSYERNVIDPKYDPLNPDTPVEVTIRALEQRDKARANKYRTMVMDQTVRRSINFTNVGKVKTKPGARSYPWDIENLNFTYAYSEQLRTNITTESYLTTNTKYAAGYNWNSSVPPIEPFKKVKLFSKPALAFIKELNFQPLPANISVRGDLDRNLIRTQLRSADVFGPLTIDPTFEKSFFFTRNYGVRYNPFKSLVIDYTASVSAIIDEPRGDAPKGSPQADTVWNNLKRLGRMKNFNQNVRVNYRLPFDKFPLTNWLSADITYGAGYIWMAQPLGVQDTLGNILQNSRERAINGRIDLLKLYNKVKFLQKINTEAPPPPPKKPAPGQSAAAAAAAAKAKAAADTSKKREFKGLKYVLRGLMSMRQINLSYTVTEGTSLPGYSPGVDYVGWNDALNAPGWDFILGSQEAEINRRAADRGWLARSRFQNMPYTQNISENLTARTSLEPLPDFRLQLDAKMTTQSAYSTIWRDTLGYLSPQTGWAALNPSRNGSYSISYISIASAFDKNDAENRSETFKKFEEYRYIFRSRLENANPARRDNERLRYDNNSQDVLIPAFLAAYSGQDPKKASLSPFPRIPLPNWRVDYAGLSKVPLLAEWFQNISLTHAYTSTYSVASYTTNLLYGEEFVNLRRRLDFYQYPNQAVATPRGDSVFTPIYPITQVVITEKFGPFVGINLRTKNKITFRFDYNRDRNVVLNLNNAQITELKSQDFTFGTGFARSGIKLPFRSQGRTIVLKNELTTRFDVTLRDTETIQRKLDEVATITQGFQDLQFKPSINYVINQRLNVQAYFEHTINTPRISTSFKRTVTRFGFQLRFTLM